MIADLESHCRPQDRARVELLTKYKKINLLRLRFSYPALSPSFVPSQALLTFQSPFLPSINGNLSRLAPPFVANHRRFGDFVRDGGRPRALHRKLDALEGQDMGLKCTTVQFECTAVLPLSWCVLEGRHVLQFGGKYNSEESTCVRQETVYPCTTVHFF